MVRRAPLVLVLIAGAVLAGAGLWSARTTPPASFGWVAYSPLSSTAYVPSGGAPWWALAMIVLGSLAVGSAGTILLLRRR